MLRGKTFWQKSANLFTQKPSLAFSTTTTTTNFSLYHIEESLNIMLLYSYSALYLQKLCLKSVL